jgi:hypothetical protein
MNTSNSIKLKAAFLLTVFALNTVVGFACSVGLDMGFNNKHHQEEAVQNSPSHSNGYTDDAKASHHHEAATRSNHHETAGPSNHHQEGVANKHHAEGALSNHHEKKTTEKDDCCNKNAVELQQVDKSLIHASNFLVKAPVFVAFLSAFLGMELATAKAVATSSKYLIPQYYPPPDIRIAIQSFQI